VRLLFVCPALAQSPVPLLTTLMHACEQEG
jgi:hypothetical protein